VTTVVERAPQTRCYRCGSRRIHTVCHRCARPMCEEHSEVVATRHGRPVIAEFAGLGLEDTPCGDAPIHCEDHRHVVRRPRHWVTATGGVLAVVGLVFAVGGRPWRGLLVIAVGLMVALAGMIAYRLRAEAAALARPVLPLFPRFDRVKVRETLRARITLDADGKYHATVEPATGCLSIAATFGREDRARVQRYRQKYQLDKGRAVAFHLGFAVIRGPAALTSGFGVHDATVLQLDGHAHRSSLLDGSSERAAEEWRKELEYEVLQPGAAGVLPITLTPSLVQEAGRRVLDLDLQWGEDDTGDRRPRPIIDRVEALELRAPLAWGDVRQADGNVLLGRLEPQNGQAAATTITWSKETITPEEHRARRRTFAVRFEHPIDAESVVRGRVEMSFKGALSRFRGVDLYYPLGSRRRDQPAATIRTHVVAEFELQLARVRYQEIRFVPDREPKPDDEFEGVIPDHTTIVALTTALSEQGFYVKRVLENPPRTGGRANLVNRYWDIAGRKYHGVYPIDFHLVVTGEEVRDGTMRAQEGTTKTALSGKGAFANPTMKEQVETVWEQLHELIAERLQ
jgi:hypothetical protein